MEDFFCGGRLFGGLLVDVEGEKDMWMIKRHSFT
jgi:hypothetical protein